MHQIRRSGWTGGVCASETWLGRTSKSNYTEYGTEHIFIPSAALCATASCIVDHVHLIHSVQHLTFLLMHSLYSCMVLPGTRQKREAAPPTCVSRRPIRTGTGPYLQCTCTHETAVNIPGPAHCGWQRLARRASLLGTIYAEFGRYLCGCNCMDVCMYPYLLIYLL